MSGAGDRLRAGRRAMVFAAIVVAALAASPLHLPLNNPNEGVRVFAAKALVEHGAFAIDEVVREWGYIDDKARHDGRLYSSKAPLMSLLGAAAYALVHPFTGDLERPALTRLCRFAGDALPSLVVAFLLWRGLRRRARDPVVADLVTTGAVLGSGVLASLQVFSGHALAALAPAAALLLVLEADEADVPGEERHREKRRFQLPVAGLLLAAAVGAEYPALLACVPVVGLAVVRAARRGPQRSARGAAVALGRLVLGAAPIVVAVSLAHAAMFGAPWRTGYSFLENPGYRQVVAGTFFGIGAPHVDVLSAVLVSPEIGLFFVSPFLVVGLVFALVQLRAREDRAWAVPVVVGTVLMLAFIAGFRGWRGGWSVGPRYISELIGLLAVPTALAFDRLSASRPVAARALLAALVAVGLVHAGIAGMFFPHLSDVYRNPVYEMMLPLVARGVSPDSVFLLVGLGPRASTVLLLVALALPLVLALAGDRRDRRDRGDRGDRRGLGLGLGAAAAAVMLALVAGPSLARTDPSRAALETRRLLDNWRPEAGVPLLAETTNARGIEDARALVAVDRARLAWPLALARGCAPPPEGRARGRLADVVTALPSGGADALVVVPDRFALDLYDAARAAPLFVTRSDVERHGKRGLPCATWLLLAAPGEPAPPSLRSLVVARVQAVPPVAGENDALELRALAAAGSAAPPTTRPGP